MRSFRFSLPLFSGVSFLALEIGSLINWILQPFAGDASRMYQNAAVLAAFLLIYSAFAGRVEWSWISGPIVFTGLGFILGPDGLGVLRLDIGGKDCALSQN